MADVWTAHDRVARDLLQRHNGREIDKTDGMLMMFDGAADAVSFAMGYHKALAALTVPLSARAGLHVGPVLLRENSADDVARGAKPLEVEGLAKPTAARVMSLARGGQTLMTTEARENLGPTELKVESLGHWMVKGVEEPIELFEVGPPGTRFTPPPDSEKVYRVVRAADWWLPVRDIPNNLPFQATSFVGREVELDEVKTYLDKSRLLTLLGMGGLGKTRLCLQAAAELIHLFPDGVWFLDLAPLRDEALVVAETAQVLGVKTEPDRPLLQSICAHLKQRRVLLILDNCEHLIKPSAELANAILKAAPYVRILATSREALRVPGEQSYPVRPLPVPGTGAGIEELAQSPAVRLFVERVQQLTALVRAKRQRSACGGRAGSAPGRHPVGARTRGRASAIFDGGGNQHPTQGSLQDPDRRRARAAGTSADAARARRLVVRPAQQTRADRALPPRCVRRRLRPGCGRTGVRHRSADQR